MEALSSAADPAPSSPRASTRPSTRRGWRRILLVLVTFAVGAALGAGPVATHLRAAALLLRFADERAQGGLADLGRHAVVEEHTAVPTAHGLERARLYLPAGGAAGARAIAGVVLVHGVHRLGIDEPRLVRFARAVAQAGVTVLTPEVQELADYRIDPRSIDTIGLAAGVLSARTGGRVGVMGMSFAGGLSLLAAADPRFRQSIGFVVAIGAHDDLARVSRFFATNRVEAPDGTSAPLQAHGYGPLVLVYGRADRFFPPEDVDAARDALRLWLWDDRAAARARAEDLSPESWAKVTGLFDDPIDFLAPEILSVVDDDAEAMTTVSPHGHLGGLEVPVFLLHGAGDNVIPAAETQWIAAEVPPAALRRALVSRAISHVELGAGSSAWEQWELVHFMAGVLDATETEAAPR